MNPVYHCYASAAFGLEGLVSKELKKKNIRDIAAENGGVRFSADERELFLCNLEMHFCDRIFIILADSVCSTFDQLFNLVYSIDWPALMSGNESIDVSAKCVKSTLMSPRDCQSVSKKAVIEKMKAGAGQTCFPESGPSLPVLVSLRNNRAKILLNTSGEALSRRGYRTWNGEAPLRETLAASLVELSPWKPGAPLHDPCCGTGTILIEAAFMASGRAPGMKRSFAMEEFCFFRKNQMNKWRSEIASGIDLNAVSDISGSDIDQNALSLASRHISQSGIGENRIALCNTPLQDLVIEKKNGTFICNPPYGERLLEQKKARLLYHDLYQLKLRHPTWHMCAITSDPAFERFFGKRADKKRRLYNGRLECVYYTYY